MVIIDVGIIHASDQHRFVMDTMTAIMDLMNLIAVSILCTIQYIKKWKYCRNPSNKKYWNKRWMIPLQHSSLKKIPTLASRIFFIMNTCWHNITIIFFNAKVGIFSQSYAVILSFISCFSIFHCLDSCFVFFKLVIFNVLVSLVTTYSYILEWLL